MKKHFLNKNIFLISFILLFFCLLPLPILYRWFNDGTIIYFWDINFPLDPALGLNHFFYLWKSNIFPGFFDTGWSWLPYIFILTIFNSISHSLSTAQALLYWFLMTASLITFYFLLRYLFRLLDLKENLFIIITEIIGSVLYAFNTYVYYYSFRIFNPQEFITAFFPLHFLALLHLFPMEKLKTKTKYRFPLVWLIVFFLTLLLMTSGFSTLIYYIEYLGIVGFYLLFQTFYRRSWSLKDILDRCWFFSLVFLFNLWWFFPMYLGLHDVYAKSSQIGTTIYFSLESQLSYLINAVRLIGLPPMQTPLFSWENLYIHNQLFTYPLFIFLLLILLLAVKLPKLPAKGLTIFLFTTFSILLFIVKEGNPPFSFILQFAFNHIPFFGVFRDAYQKAGLFYTFTYFLLFSIALGVICNSFLDKKKYLALIIMLISLIAGIVMTAPFFIFQNIPYQTTTSQTHPIVFSAKTKIPDEYFGLKSFLEPNCQKTEVLVLPRTSILSSAYWPDSGYSYVGQDILSNLIGCNFISTQVLDSNIDAYYSVPYLALEQNNINAFKKFLFNSSIQLIVVRHDYVDNNLTDYAPVNVNSVLKDLNGDSDFIHVYRNKLLDVYKYSKLDGVQYGINFPQVTLFTNVDFTSGHATQTLFSTVLTKDTFINNTITAVKPQETIAYANCVGCEYLPGSGALDENVTIQATGNRLLQFIKKILHRHTEQADSLDRELNTLETSFQSWMHSGSLKDAESYKTSLNRTMNYYRKHLQGDFFGKDYTTIKVKNYLVNEFTILSDSSKGPGMHRVPLDNVSISNLQQKSIVEAEHNIWETDFGSQVLRYRLDIPESGNYVCRIDNNNKLISINNVIIDKNYIDKTAISLSKDSHMLEVSYTIKNLYSQIPFILSGNKVIVKKIQLHEFTPGSYYNISMKTTSPIKRMTVFISHKDMSSQTAIKLATDQNQNFIYNSNKSQQNFLSGINDYFYSSNTINDTYYLYIVANFQTDLDHVSFSKFNIIPIPTKDTIIPYCQNNGTTVMPIIPFSVSKQNPTAYTITIPKYIFVNNRVLTFNQSYSPLWTAYTVINGRKHLYNHSLQAGYANAWYIDVIGDDKIYLLFAPERQAEFIGIFSIFSFMTLASIYVVFKNKEKH